MSDCGLQIDLVLIGFGNVARGLVTLLQEEQTRLVRSHGFSTRVVAIATRRHGRLLSPRGLDAVALAERVSLGEALASRESPRAASCVDFIRHVARTCATAARQRRLVVIETTTLNIERGEPAVSHVRAALGGGAHVVTANKAPAAFAYRALAAAAARANRRFLFEGAVMDGVPIFNLVRETLPALRVTGFRGVVNSTTNFILTAMEQREDFDAALKRMQDAGIAEADASLDVDGWDAAAKAAALANVLLGANVTPHTVAREGITRDTAIRAVAARAAGKRLKLVVRGIRNGLKAVPYTRNVVGDRLQAVPNTGTVVGDGLQAVPRVALEELPADDLLASLEGPQNALILETDWLGEIAIVQRDGGLTQTAYALLSDLTTIARELSAGSRATRRPPTRARGDRSRRATDRR